MGESFTLIEMTGLTNFQAFLSGLLIGIILPLIFLQIRKILPTIKNRSSQGQIHKIGFREKETELKIRQYMIRKCQANHLLSFICPLNEIYVDNNLISRYYYTNADDIIENEPLIFQFFPELTDFPELSTLYPSPQISLFDAVQSHRNIAIMGEIGSGKTSLLSHFCSEVHTNKTNESPLTEYFPLYFNLQELPLEFHTDEIIDQISEILASKITGLGKDSCKRFLEKLCEEDHLILIFDGLDEINSSEFDSFSEQLSRISIALPKVQLLTAIGVYYTSNLSQAGFSFCTMRSPDQDFREEMRCKLFSKLIIEQEDPSAEVLKNVLVLWDHQIISYDTPGQIILNLLSAISTNNHSMATKTSFLQTLSSDVEILTRLKKVANKIWLSKNRTIDSLVIKQLLSDPINEINPVVLTPLDVSGDRKSKSSDYKDNFSELLSLGIFRKVKNDIYHFSNPLVFCELLALSEEIVINEDPKLALKNPIFDYLLKHSSLRSNYIKEWLSRPIDPLQGHVMVNACRHLILKKKSDPTEITKDLSKLICSQQLAFSVKFKLFLALLKTNEGNSQRVLDSISNQTSDRLLLNRLITIALFQMPPAVGINAFSQVISSRDSVTLSLALIWYLSQRKNQSSPQILSLLNRSDDFLALLVMEILVLDVSANETLFSELLESPNILIRKAIVHGLRYARQPWAVDLLNRMLADEDQWIVRDAVSHALESPWENKMVIPCVRENPNQSPWLLQQASLRGIGIPAAQYPEELILDILKQGNLEEKKIALGYLEDFPTKTSIKTLQLMSQGSNLLQEAALSAMNRIFMQKKYFDLLA